MTLRKGITIIELMVVMLVVAVVLNIGISSFVSVEKQYLKKAAVDLQSDIRAMQRLSMSERTQYSLTFLFDTETHCNQYEISYFDVEKKADVIVDQTTFPKGVSLLSTNTPQSIIKYTNRGTISSGACSIILNSENYNIALTLNVGVGRVSIKEIRPIEKLFTQEELQELY